MPDFPNIDVIAVFCNFAREEQFTWRQDYRREVKGIHSIKPKTKDGSLLYTYIIETDKNELLELIFDTNAIRWGIGSGAGSKDPSIDKVLVHIKKTRKVQTKAHRVIPYRFELIPTPMISSLYEKHDLTPNHYLQPYRFMIEDQGTLQVIEVVTRHIEDMKVKKAYNFVVKTTSGKYYHLIYMPETQEWVFIQEVDEELFFLR